MKTITKYVTALLVILLCYQCENENTVEISEPSSSFQILQYEALPAAIRAEVTTTENALKNTYAHKNETPFGEVAADRIHQRLKPNGNTSYTLRLNRTGEGFYYDNLVITEDAGGALTTRIIRYQPDPEWYYLHKTEGLGYNSYSGSISVFSYNGGLISAVALEGGTIMGSPVAKTNDLRNGTGCEIIDIQEAGLEQEGIFYIYEITITVDCTGTGGGGYEEEGLNDDFGSEGPEEGGGGAGPGGGGGGTGGPGEPIDTVPVEEEITIDPDFIEDYPCQAAIVQAVYGNCAPLAQLFQDIFESSDTFNVTFTAENLNNEALAADTNGETPNNYEIRLNTERLEQSTELDIINTVTHEYVHAIMYHYFYQGSFQLTGAGDPPSYAELAEGFAKHRAGFGGDHHPYMTSLVHDIAEVTYTWAMANGYSPGDFTAYDEDPADTIDGLKEFLIQLAWNGLTGTTTFQELYPEDSPGEIQIRKIIKDEGFPDAYDATPQGNLPVPCN